MVPASAGYVALPVDENYKCTRFESAAASAVYKKDNACGDDVFAFRALKPRPDAMVQVIFANGPVSGQAKALQSGEVLPLELRIFLGANNQQVDADADPVSLAIYGHVDHGPLGTYQFTRLETAAAVLECAKAEWLSGVVRNLAYKFYENPDYSAYSITPTDNIGNAAFNLALEKQRLMWG
jgi:hypothetical protein